MKFSLRSTMLLLFLISFSLNMVLQAINFKKIVKERNLLDVYNLFAAETMKLINVEFLHKQKIMISPVSNCTEQNTPSFLVNIY